MDSLSAKRKLDFYFLFIFLLLFLDKNIPSIIAVAKQVGWKPTDPDWKSSHRVKRRDYNKTPLVSRRYNRQVVLHL